MLLRFFPCTKEVHPHSIPVRPNSDQDLISPHSLHSRRKQGGLGTARKWKEEWLPFSSNFLTPLPPPMLMSSMPAMLFSLQHHYLMRHTHLESKENYHQRNDIVFKQVLPTSTIGIAQRTVRRICV